MLKLPEYLAPLMVVLALGAVPACALPLVTTSSSGRFAVVGPDPAENTEYTRWAEDLAKRLERVLGNGAAIPKGSPVEIILDESRSAGPTVTAGVQRRDSALPVLTRTLVVRRFLPVDQDLLQEGLVRLILAGLVERQRQEAGFPVVVPAFPQWLTMGLAQNLDPEGLARNRKIAASSGLGMESITASEVIGWIQLPEGWHTRKALCGLVTAWLLSQPGGPDAVRERMIRQEPMSAEWVADRIMRVRTVARMDSEWRAWRQRQGRVIQEFGGLSSAMIDQLRRELPLRVGVPVAGDDPARGTWLRPEEVISARKTDRSVALRAVEKIEKIRIATLGKAPELVAVGEAYARFYQGVARGAWALTLKWRLARANDALARLDQLTLAREAYLDEVESEGISADSRPADAVGPVGVPELEKSQMESYLDAAEKRFHKP